MRIRYLRYTDILCAFFSLYVLGSYTVPMLGWNTYLLQVPLYLFLIFSIINIILRRTFLDQQYMLWYVMFVMISVVSMVYSYSTPDSISMFSYLVTAIVFAMSIFSFLQVDKALPIIKYSHILVAICVGANLILNFTQAHWWSRLGESFGMNENMVALYFLIPFCFSIIETVKTKKIVLKLLNCLSIFICGYVILLSGSKKALFASAIFCMAFYFLRAKNAQKKMKIVLITVVILFAIYELIMNVPLLYNILGFRLDAMFLTMQTKNFGNTGSSTAERGDMIKYGFSLFLSSPILGRGINTFRELYGSLTGYYAYAHNNYVELLADLGIIGFSVYYSLHIKILKTGFTGPYNQKKENAEYIAFLIMLLFFDLAMVTYYDTRIIMILAICYYETKFGKSQYSKKQPS